MRARYLLAAVASTIVVGLVLATTPQPVGATQQALAAFLPKAGEVAGWQIVAKSDAYAPNPGKLSVIYDGGDGAYIKAGVTECLSRTYQSGKTYLTVRVHKLGTSTAKAKAFYTAKQGTIKKANGYTTVAVKDGGCYAPSGGLTVGFSYTKYYVVTYVATTTHAQGATKAFIQKVAGKMARAG